MVFVKYTGEIGKDDRALVKVLCQEKNWTSRRLLREFPGNNCARTSAEEN